jgi:hypothetical protein
MTKIGRARRRFRIGAASLEFAEEQGARLSGRETCLAVVAVLSLDSGDASQFVSERQHPRLLRSSRVLLRAAPACRAVRRSTGSLSRAVGLQDQGCTGWLQA